ncbi:MAG: pyrroloquinoline quinone precursor peptide PqqA [Acetobacteraceae bacterium]|nr:pyrroloquinoline quinone precursor peptide PqqA [Acetobacteraceae bacterium]
MSPNSVRCTTTGGRTPMAWKKPRIVEVSLALEINAYACAEIG